MPRKLPVRISGLKQVVNDSFRSLLNYFDKRIIITYGGAGSGKSVASAQTIVISLLMGRNQLIVRKVARTHRHSTFAEVLSAIDQLKVSKLFKIREHEMFIRCINGAEAHFVGCDNVEKLKSIRPTFGLFDDIHIEEATEISLSDFYILDTRQRGQDITPRRIFLRFNPIYSHHWIKKEFFDANKWDCLVHKTTYLDNKFLAEIDKLKYESYKEIDEYMYQVYALGNWGILGGVIFKNIERVTERPDEVRGVKPYFGLDFGYENPAGCIKVYCTPEILYFDDEVYERKLSNKQLAEEIRPMVRDNYVTCDSEEPKSIAELKQYGIRTIKAKKGKGSVQTGIKFMKARRLIVNERCVNMIKELETYRRKKDKDGNYLEEVVKENDHLIDATRYALEPEFIHAKVTTAKI